MTALRPRPSAHPKGCIPEGIVRPARIVDIEQCERLDGSYATDSVWQMEESQTPDKVVAAFQQMQVPRSVQVAYPRSLRDLTDDWKRGECFLVIEEWGKVWGYLDMIVQHWRWQGWIEHLVVHPSYRRRGLATRLLEAAEHWARGSELETVTAVLQTKNGPAIRLLTQRGYVFRGFMDKYFENGDVGLFFSLSL